VTNCRSSVPFAMHDFLTQYMDAYAASYARANELPVILLLPVVFGILAVVDWLLIKWKTYKTDPFFFAFWTLATAAFGGFGVWQAYQIFTNDAYAHAVGVQELAYSPVGYVGSSRVW